MMLKKCRQEYRLESPLTECSNGVAYIESDRISLDVKYVMVSHYPKWLKQ